MKYLILGATGTLGREITRQLLAKDAGGFTQIVCFSRDELKQKQMEAEFGKDKRLEFVLGDIRDCDSLYRAMNGVETIFHVAALKHVDSMEDNPSECFKTNVLGTQNVINMAKYHSGIRHVVFSSTDKAVDPINVYGLCKATSEKLLYRENELDGARHRRFSVFRWGNVLASRGSVIPQFVKDLMTQKKVRITHPEMTRFWIRIQDAVSFMLKEYAQAPLHEAAIPPIKAASVLRVVEAIAQAIGVGQYEVEFTGMRRGEKIHEFLRSQHHPEPLNSLMGPQLSEEELFGLLEDAIREYAQ